MRPALPKTDEIWQHPVVTNIAQNISQFNGGRFVLGCSGGHDSLLLLHVLAHVLQDKQITQNNLQVVYINHQINVDAAQWGHLVQQHCQQLNIEFFGYTVTLNKGNTEEQARHARYQALFAHMQPNDILVLAHHANDQAETFFLRLLRGSGLRGLTAMKAIDYRNNHTLWRPFLSFSKTTLKQLSYKILNSYVKDPANTDNNYDRVWLRQQILPALQARKPQLFENMSRSTQLLQQAQDILQEVYLSDLQNCQQLQYNSCSLHVDTFNKLSPSRQQQLLNGWIQQSDAYPPSYEQVQAVLQLFLPNMHNKQFLLRQSVFHRFDDQVYYYNKNLIDHLAAIEKEQSFQLNSNNRLAIELPFAKVQFDVNINTSTNVVNLNLALKPTNQINSASTFIKTRAGHKSLKKCLNEWRILPWWRQRVYLLYAHHDIVMIILYDCAILTQVGRQLFANWHIQHIILVTNQPTSTPAIVV